MKVQTSVRVEEIFYKEAKEVFKKFGLSFGDGVNIFLAKVSMEKAIPFDLSIPDKDVVENIGKIGFHSKSFTHDDEDYSKW